jgi:hypothetical protein
MAVSAMQIHNYETGRRGRVPHLPALLDVAYDAFGTSCFEPVRTTDLRPGAVAAAFPDYWIGPVTVVARPVGRTAARGPLTLRWRGRLRQVQLCSGPATFGCLRLPEDGDLIVTLPAGWRLDVRMGHDPGARELLTDWVPVSPEVGRATVGRVLASVCRAVGVSEEELHRAISGAAEGPLQHRAAPESTIRCTSTPPCTHPRPAPTR